jgi:alkylation response protein AidB-like acyl-CoA dehydrogenase
MDFAFTEEQQQLRELARRILTDRVTHESLTDLEAFGAERFDPALWAELARANLLGVALPETIGGLGYGLIELCVLLEEIGRTLAPVPAYASLVLGALPLLEYGTTAQQEEWLPAVATGERILTAALAGPVDADTTARRIDGGWRIDGVRTGVPAATLADLLLVPAATDAGTAIFLLRPGTPGLSIQPQRTTARQTTGLLRLDGIEAGDEALLGGTVTPAAAGWLRDRAVLGVCALQLGVTDRALRATADYATTREQFRRPIGSFQAVGHRLADAYIDVEAIRLALWQAAWQASAGLDAEAAIATAKFWAAEGGHRVAHAAVHVHGGMGIAEEHFLHRYFLHAKQLEFTLGGATEQALRLGLGMAGR